MRQLPITRHLSILGATLALSACSSLPAPGTLMITNANVISGEGNGVLENQAIIVDGNKIVAIKNMDSVNTFRDIEVLDAKNAYLLPGFIDTHAHVGIGPVGFEMEDGAPVFNVAPSDDIADQTLDALLKYGVTTARDPGGSTATTISAKRRIESGDIVGPKLFTAGLILDTARFENLATTVTTPEDIRKEVAHQIDQGVDWIKLYTGLKKEMVAAAIDEAHTRGAKVTGHLENTTWTEASELGIDSIVHITPGSKKLLPVDKQAEYEASKTKATFMLKWFELADFDSPEITDMIASLRDNKVSIDPTLVIFHAMTFGDDDAYLKNPDLDQVAPELLENWRSFFNFNIGWTAEDYEYARAVWPRVSEFTKLLHDSGIVLTVGTDANNPWIVPGESFHTELELLVNAGISEQDVIKMATRNGAELLGVLGRVGTIAPNKQADFVLVKSNPYENIRSTRDIIWVMQNGKIQ